MPGVRASTDRISNSLRVSDTSRPAATTRREATSTVTGPAVRTSLGGGAERAARRSTASMRVLSSAIEYGLTT